MYVLVCFNLYKLFCKKSLVTLKRRYKRQFIYCNCLTLDGALIYLTAEQIEQIYTNFNFIFVKI